MSDITSLDEPFLSEKSKTLLKKGLLKEFSEEDQEVFFHYVELTQLDPFTKQIYATSRVARSDDDDRNQGPRPLTIVTGIGGFLWVAERTGKYDGDDAPEWCGIDDVWKDVWTDRNLNPSACRVKTWRKDRTHASVAVVNWSAVAQYKRKYVDRKPTNEWEPTAFWKKAGPGQLAKCALAASLRKLFPSQLAGVYTDDEIGGELPSEQLDTKLEGIDEAAHYADRAKISEKLMEAEKPNGSHANLVTHTDVRKEVKPEDMEDALAPETTNDNNLSADWWKTYKIEVIKKISFTGKLVSELDDIQTKAIIELWAPKVGLRPGIESQIRKVMPEYGTLPDKTDPNKTTLIQADPSKQGEVFKLTAEAVALKYLDDMIRKAKEALL